MGESGGRCFGMRAEFIHTVVLLREQMFKMSAKVKEEVQGKIFSFFCQNSFNTPLFKALEHIIYLNKYLV